MWKILALLPCLLLVSEVRASCPALLACANVVNESTFLQEASLIVYADEAAVLSAICGELGGLTSCIEANLDTCSDTTIKNKAKTSKDILQYMCSPDGQQVLLQLADSDCFEDPQFQTHFDILMNGCVLDFILSLQLEQINALIEGRDSQLIDVCPFTDAARTCFVDSAADLCGPAMGTFMANIWHIYSADEFAQFECHEEVAHKRRALKRALPMIMKRAALIKKFKK